MNLHAVVLLITLAIGVESALNIPICPNRLVKKLKGFEKVKNWALIGLNRDACRGRNSSMSVAFGRTAHRLVTHIFFETEHVRIFENENKVTSCSFQNKITPMARMRTKLHCDVVYSEPISVMLQSVAMAYPKSNITNYIVAVGRSSYSVKVGLKHVKEILRMPRQYLIDCHFNVVSSFCFGLTLSNTVIIALIFMLFSRMKRRIIDMAISINLPTTQVRFVRTPAATTAAASTFTATAAPFALASTKSEERPSSEPTVDLTVTTTTQNIEEPNETFAQLFVKKH